ncbi:MAG: chromosome segregation ATPase [Pseudomonadales bacterium]|jgi:chromosome segregation ATPase
MPSRRDEDPVLSSTPLIADRGDRKSSNGMVKKSAGAPAAKGSSSGTKLMLVIAVIGLVGLAAWIAEMQKQLQASSNLLVTYQENMQALEQRLSITDESMMQSDTQFEDKVKVLDSEVRKLWDNVWKKTKTELAKHDKALAEQNKKIISHNATIASLEKTNANIDSKLGTNQIAISALNEQLYVANDNATAIVKSQTQMTGLAQSLKAVKESTGSLTSQQQDLLKRVIEAEEWVESFNGYRREVNQKLLRLEGPPAQ